MRTHTGLAMFMGAILCSCGAAQAQTDAQTGGNSVSLASGTTVNAELSASIDSKKAKAGDSVMAQVIEAVKEDGKTLIPKGTKIVGHVTQASARSKGDAESSLAIRFDKAVLKNGQEITLSVWIRAIAVEPRNVYQPGPEQSTIAGTPAAGQSPMGASHSTMSGPPAATAPPVGASTDTGAGSERTAGAAGGLNSAGQLAANSRGVFGLEGVQLSTDASSTAQGSLISSSGKNLHLDSGTRLLLAVLADASTTPNK